MKAILILALAVCAMAAPSDKVQVVNTDPHKVQVVHTDPNKVNVVDNNNPGGVNVVDHYPGNIIVDPGFYRPVVPNGGQGEPVSIGPAWVDERLSYRPQKPFDSNKPFLRNN